MDLQEIFAPLVYVAYFAFLILIIASGWQLFTKAGKPGWAVLIPIYNLILLLEIVGKPVWWVLLMFFPFVNLIASIWIANLLVKSFGKTELYTIGMIFLPFICYPLLAFGSSQYQGPAGSGVTLSPAY
ncbi:MAG: DUF5684 domain-containing protein [Tunicatimonas sp.]